MDAETIRQITTAVPAPLNVMTGPGGLTVAQLADLGVRRVSTGMAIAQAAYANVHRAAVELLTHGTYTALDGGLDYGALNATMSRG